MDKLRISFDFDSTLSTQPMQELCKKFLLLGAEVYVTTTRQNGVHSNLIFENKDLFEVTDKLGIKRENITFTKYQDKVVFVKQFDFHFDDDAHEIFLINQHPSKCLGFLFEQYQDINNGIAPNF
ncbi:hypothetical protein [Thalassobellus suaedae]|uniref:Haloacid dehalogenase-like hydrolase n=1 Tax=Thalassobellus suaedae TaxID=3074124 RepID=A0ABY9XVS7_9FLAO|nr:hypothetical protein RHP51_05020 [Flavobacteriaceae bacterium HL-DH14]